jgi:hypothetical protein
MHLAQLDPGLDRLKDGVHQGGPVRGPPQAIVLKPPAA